MLLSGVSTDSGRRGLARRSRRHVLLAVSRAHDCLELTLIKLTQPIVLGDLSSLDGGTSRRMLAEGRRGSVESHGR